MKTARVIYFVLAISSMLGLRAVQGQVVISEFMAANSNGIRDDDGTRSDWIELFNTSDFSADLGGWFLTDNALNPSKWEFPAGTVLPPNSYLLVWSSGRNKTNPAAPLHANFKLAREGGYLALLDSLTNLASVFESYPIQTADISYGRDRVDSSVVGFFNAPTPGAQNAMSGLGFAQAPRFSHKSGIYTNASISLVITASLGIIRYTVDGDLPTTNSPVYTGPMILSTNATIKARVYPPPETSLLPSEVVASRFVFLDGTTANFDSNLPLLIISTEGRPIRDLTLAPGAPRTNGTLMLIDGKNSRGSLRSTPDLLVQAGFEYYGFSSSLFPKKPIRFETQDELGNDIKVSILGMPADADYKLRNPYDDRTLLNDYLGTELFEEMGHYSVRRRFVEAFVDTNGLRLNYTNDYYGVLVLLEEIKIAEDRVNIAPIPSTALMEPAISGGYIFNKTPRGLDPVVQTSGGPGFPPQQFALHDPNPNNLRVAPGSSTLTLAGSNQMNSLLKYLNLVDSTLYSNTWLVAAGTNHYSHYLDVDSFVDWHWIVEFTRQIDGYAVSTYFYKDRQGKVFAGPVWDFNLGFGNNRNGAIEPPNGWIYERNYNAWHQRLIGGPSPNASTNDPDFTQKIADRWSVLRTNLCSPVRLQGKIDYLAASLYEAALRDQAKYHTSGVYNAYSGDSFIGRMKNYIQARYGWIDSQFTLPPNLSATDGMTTNGLVLTISGKPGSQIYYTTDGTDPRGAGGKTNGVLYTGPISISGNMAVVARCRETSAWKDTWSGPSRAILYTAVPPLRITEIMYHPASPPLGSTNTDSDFEYVEVRNFGDTPLSLNRFSITGGIEFQFPNMSLNPGQSGVIVRNLDAFQSRYGTNNPSILILGVFTGQLNDAGDRLILKGAVGEPILDFSYADNWFPATDGLGFSLVKAGDALTTTNWGLANEWRPSTSGLGSPGQPESGIPQPPVVLVNEVLAHSEPAADAVELYNPSAIPVDLSGWFLSDDFFSPKKYIIPFNTIIPAHSYLVFYETNSFNFPTNSPASFALGAKGDDIWLFSGNGVDLTGYAHGFSFGDSPSARTFGRYVTSQGGEHFVLQTSSTLGGLNSGPLVGPLVLTEINPQPADARSYLNDEFIELQNITSVPVPLYDPAFPTNTWRLQDAVSYSFPKTNVVVPPRGILLLVNFDPEADPVAAITFRERNGVPADVPLFGPWTGALNDTSDDVVLARPDQPDGLGSVAYFTVDRFKYSGKAPWPSLWKGTGLTLNRRSLFGYGNDPTNWLALAATPGKTSPQGGALPVITSQPADLIAPAGRPLILSLGAAGDELAYQWLRNGTILAGATNSSLVISNFQPQHIGNYKVIVYNSAGSVSADPFEVYFRFGLQFLQHPVERKAVIGSTTSFTVTATGAGSLSYQWKMDGTNVTAVNVSGVNTTNLVITNVQTFNEGVYTVSVTDDFDTFTSEPAKLTLIYKPTFVVHPLSQQVVQGGIVTLSAYATGDTPMTFRWRKQTGQFSYTTLATNSGPAFSFFTITNFQASDATNYNVTLSNLVGFAAGGPMVGISSNAVLTFIADTDHDGLPDNWENTRAGFNPTDPTDALRDDDGDGMNNQAEFIAGTDYLDPQSFLKVNINSNGTTISFLAISNRTYSILYSDTLGVPFSKLVDALALPTNGTRTFIDPSTRTNRYYRLSTPIQR